MKYATLNIVLALCVGSCAVFTQCAFNKGRCQENPLIHQRNRPPSIIVPKPIMPPSVQCVDLQTPNNNNPSNVLHLIQQGADSRFIVDNLRLYGGGITAVNDMGFTPLHYTVLFNGCKQNRSLINTYRCTHKKVPSSAGPVSLVKKTGTPTDFHLIKSLLEQGADVNALTHEGLTPWHFAIIKGNYELLAVLKPMIIVDSHNLQLAYDLLNQHWPLRDTSVAANTVRNKIGAMLKTLQPKPAQVSSHSSVEQNKTGRVMVSPIADLVTMIPNNNDPADDTVEDA